MTPDELRAAANKEHVSEQFYADTCRRLADVIEYAERVDRPSPKFTSHVLRIVRGEITEEEKP